MERKIHQSTINNKWAKINIGGMGIRGKKETKKSLRDVYRSGKWFWNDREGILRMRNKSRLSEGKSKIWDVKEKEKKENKEK